MSEVVDESLTKITKGTGIVFVGTVIGMLFAFFNRVLIARFFSQTEYGVFSLGFVILSIFVVISLFGLQDGVARQIGYYRGKNEYAKVKGIIFSSIQIVLITSIVLLVTLYFISDVISTKIFHEPLLAEPLKVFAFAIPFLALTQLFVSIFRGFESVKEGIYFQNILLNTIFISFITFAIFLNLSFIYIIYAFTLSSMILCTIFISYITKNFTLLERRKEILATNPIIKELILFSMPLLGAYILAQIMNWTDTLMLGYFTTSDIVGLYNAAAPLARFIVTFLYSTHPIFIPVVAKLCSQNLIVELKRSYQILTKWIVFAVLPIFFTLLFYPEVILNLIFGFSYIKASTVLQILAICFFIHVALGPSGASLISMGESRFVMYTTILGTSMNIFLNAILIPKWGIVGAAIATAASLVTVHVSYLCKLYRISKIHPFTNNYIIFLIMYTSISLSIHIFLKNIIPTGILQLFLFFASSTIIGIFTLIVSRSIEREDIVLLVSIEKKLGIDLTMIKNILKRFA